MAQEELHLLPRCRLCLQPQLVALPPIVVKYVPGWPLGRFRHGRHILFLLQRPHAGCDAAAVAALAALALVVIASDTGPVGLQRSG